MPTEKRDLPDARQIRMLIEDRVKAVQARDINAAANNFVTSSRDGRNAG